MGSSEDKLVSSSGDELRGYEAELNILVCCHASSASTIAIDVYLDATFLQVIAGPLIFNEYKVHPLLDHHHDVVRALAYLDDS